MAQVKAHINYRGIVKGLVYKIYERDGDYLYLEDHLNCGRIVQYPIIRKANHNEKTTEEAPKAMP